MKTKSPQLNRELLEWATGQLGDWVISEACVNAVGEKRKIYCASTCQEICFDIFQTHTVSFRVGQII
jgi:hypothetical protein